MGMVLDEEALEAMLRRQQTTDDDGEAPPAQLTDETEEFEVYERPGMESAEKAPEPAPTPSGDAAEASHAQRDLFEELPGRDQEEEIPVFEDDPEPEPGPPPRPAPRPEPGPESGPEQGTQPSGASTTSGSPVASAPRRPQVFPPLHHEEAAPTAPTNAPATPPATPAAPPAAPPTSHAPPAASRPAPTPRHEAGGEGCRIGLVHCTFNHEITDRMAQTARETAETLGAAIVDTLRVNGVYDAPFAAQLLARRPDVDAVVVVGAVVKGDTDHDGLITHAAAKALLDVSLREQVPLGLGITGPGMSWAEAEARIGNAGHAVEAVIVQWRLLQTA